MNKIKKAESLKTFRLKFCINDVFNNLETNSTAIVVNLSTVIS